MRFLPVDYIFGGPGPWSAAEFLTSQGEIGAVPALTAFQQGLATEELSDAFPQ